MENKVKKIFLSNFKPLVMDGKKPWLVKFTSDTCHLCHGLAPVFDNLALAFKGKVNFGTINIRVEKKLAKIFINDGVPTIYFFKNGKSMELSWPASPNPESGYGFEDLASYLTWKLNENE